MSYEVKDVSLEGRTYGEMCRGVPSEYGSYRVVRYVVRMPPRDRYVRHKPIETREEAAEELIYETLIDERPLAWKYSWQ